MRLHILVMAWWIVVALGRPYHSCFNLQLLSMPGLNCTILICRRSCTFIFNINKWLTNKITTSNKSRFITCQQYQFVIILCIETTNLLSCHPRQWFDTNPLRGNSKWYWNSWFFYKFQPQMHDFVLGVVVSIDTST